MLDPATQSGLVARSQRPFGPRLPDPLADPRMRAAQAAGWRRRDLWWERIAEGANAALAEGAVREAVRRFHNAHRLSRLWFPAQDPRRATSLANAVLADRLSGQGERAAQGYAEALTLWRALPNPPSLSNLAPRGRSSLFHLRMELRHAETYRRNMETRIGRFMAEAEEALSALARNETPPQGLYPRWRGHRPAVFDDTRIWLAACLLIATEEPPGKRAMGDR